MENFKCRHCGRAFACPTCGRPYKNAKDAARCVLTPKGKKYCDRCKKDFTMTVGAAMVKLQKIK